MNILIIDDQPIVIEGVLAGVDWEKLPIEKKFAANNIIQAKEIIEKESVQLMLCDIEMPMGSGLELYEWVQKNRFKIKCIFLTSHSDFCYAQQAIHLQGFDYLLQPVSYKKIAESIEKAVSVIEAEKNIGKSILREYLTGLRSNSKEIEESMAIFSSEGNVQKHYNFVLIHILTIKDNNWNCSLIQDAIERIAGNLFSEVNRKTFFVQITLSDMLCIYLSEEGDKQKTNEYPTMLYKILEEKLPVRVSIYYENEILFTDFPDSLKGLLKKSSANVTGKSGVLNKYEKTGKENGYMRPDLNKWNNFIQSGYYDLLKKEAFEYLDRQVRENHMSMEILKKFHQDYLCLFFSTIKNISSPKVNTESDEENETDYLSEEQDQVIDYNYEALMNSYTSVERMKSLIDFSTRYLEKNSNHEEFCESRMEEIMKYIHNNIQKNITRKDVAEAVYLNPEYLSRFFRKEKRMKLTDYILQEKMEIAKHLLETTKFPVCIVASKVGYTNFSHFAQRFKQFYGISLSEVSRES